MGIIENAIGGIVAAVVTAGIFWVYTRSRNAKMEAKLRKVLQPTGIGWGDRVFNLVVVNSTDAPAVVRGVYLVATGKQRVLMKYEEPGGLVRDKVDMQSSDLLDQAQRERGFVVLPPQTEGLWKFGVDFYRNFKGDIEVIGAMVVVEYRSLLGGSTVLTIDSDRSMSSQIALSFQTFLKEAAVQVEQERAAGADEGRPPTGLQLFGGRSGKPESDPSAPSVEY